MKSVLLTIFSCLSILSFAQPGQGPEATQIKNTLLTPAFWQGKPGVEVVRAEIAKGNNPSELNSASYDPVVMAINSGAPDESILYLMEQKGNDVNKLTHDKRTYIFWAASKGNTKIMKYLLSKGAKINITGSHGYTPLLFAAVGGQKNTEVYDLLIAHGLNIKTNVSPEGANALLLAIGSDNNLELTKYFQSKGVDIKSVDNEGNTAFNYAARSGNIAVMKSLLAQGVKFTNEAMVLASLGGRRGSNSIEVFQYLESLGIKPNTVSKSGANALHGIVRRPGQTDLVKYFLSKGTDVNQKDDEGNTVFMNAAASSDLPTIELLFSSLKDINTVNETGASALALAVKSNTPDVIEYLLDKGAKVNIEDTKGYNLGYYLIESFNTRTATTFESRLKLLLGKGLNLTTPQKDGNTLFHLAVAKNDLELLKKLSGLGIDINAKNKEGNTALHKAAMISKNDEVLRYLISLGAAKDIKTEFEETAYDLAKENGFLKKQGIAVDFLK